MVNIKDFVDFDVDDLEIDELVRFAVLNEILDEFENEDDIKNAIIERKDELIPKHIINDDILASINYHTGLAFGIGSTDDIDHLGNRRLRCVGELLQNQFRIGLSRMERVVRERMTIQDLEIIIHPRCVNFLTEISNYTWDKDKFNNKLNKPIDDFNHLMDAMRYALEKYIKNKGWLI